MKISFIIPVYNCKAYLSVCVDSIRSVTAEDYEILLIDDGSTDGSGALCDDLASKFPVIRVVHQSNAGVSAARNRGICEAQGDYILFVDSDDALTPFTDRTVECLKAGTDMVMFGMEFSYYHRDRYVRKETKAVSRMIYRDLRELPDCFEELFFQNYLSPVWNKFIKRSILVDHNLRFDTRLINYEDLAFTLQVLSKCKAFAAVSDVNYLYRVDYDHDRTVDRIARIEDLLGNTDIIAESFVQLEQAIYEAGGENTDALKACLRNIYFELFGVKMKTTGIGAISRYCRDFVRDNYVKDCVECAGIEPGWQEQMYNWILQEKAPTIWLRTRYGMLRHFVARNIKRILKWRLS
jgi:glycosyltransferase involved in cell wall biosynthesis